MFLAARRERVKEIDGLSKWVVAHPERVGHVPDLAHPRLWEAKNRPLEARFTTRSLSAALARRFIGRTRVNLGRLRRRIEPSRRSSVL